jgi:hypothetical protein
MIRTAEAEAHQSKKQLRMLEESTSLRLGRTLVSAARQPARAGLMIPREVVRLWRRRGRRMAGGRAATSAKRFTIVPTPEAPPRDSFVEARRLLRTQVRPDQRPAIFGCSRRPRSAGCCRRRS